jgi:hypothetical protein
MRTATVEYHNPVTDEAALDLHPQQTRAIVGDEIVALVLAERFRYGVARLGQRDRNAQFRDIALQLRVSFRNARGHWRLDTINPDGEIEKKKRDAGDPVLRYHGVVHEVILSYQCVTTMAFRYYATQFLHGANAFRDCIFGR